MLAILVGAFGAHKFYLGKNGQGILYLLFFWTAIPAIIGTPSYEGGIVQAPPCACPGGPSVSGPNQMRALSCCAASRK